jgi:hypothetical protein
MLFRELGIRDREEAGFDDRFFCGVVEPKDVLV